MTISSRAPSLDAIAAMGRSFARFAQKVVVLESGCWRWTGKVNRGGYGCFSIGHARHATAHRWLYQQIQGPLSPAVDLDHLCRNRWCVNPAHCEPVTRRENLLRGLTIPAAHVAKTHCPQGHPYDEPNTYRYRGMRQCRASRDARDAGRRRPGRSQAKAEARPQ